MKTILILIAIVILIAIIGFLVVAYVVLHKRDKEIKEQFPLSYKELIPSSEGRSYLFRKDIISKLRRKNDWWKKQENTLVENKIAYLKEQFPHGWNAVKSQYSTLTEDVLIQHEDEIRREENRIHSDIECLKKNYPNGWKSISIQYPQCSDVELFQKYTSEIKSEDIKIKAQFLEEKYPNGWQKFCNQHPTYSLEQLVSSEDEISKADILYHKEETIKSDISALQDACQTCNTTEAQTIIKHLKDTINTSPEIDSTLKEQAKSQIDDFNKKYIIGIIDIYEDTSVNYNAPKDFVQNDNWKYVVAKFPKNGTHIFPHRRKKIARRGYKEEDFENFLSNKLSQYGLSILGDCSLLPYNGYRPYEPDIAIIDRDNTSIRIDIEIDEPYAAITNEPTHYIGCGDDIRDMQLNNLGWIVVRFSELQVHKYPLKCVYYIAQLIYAINPNKEFPSNWLTGELPISEKRWTKIESQQKAVEKYREQYLQHSFGTTPVAPITQIAITQTAEEKASAKKIQPINFHLTKKPKLPIAQINSTLRDKNIQFYPKEHIYLYKGKIEFTQVSSVISYFFPFDSFYWSNIKASKKGVPQDKILEEWDLIGAKAREVGMFLQQQIESHYTDGPFRCTYPFHYDGKYYKEDCTIDISQEYNQFMSFKKDNQLSPCKIGWAIYDENLRIAGTIDMLCSNGGDTFDIYDWKRSQKIVDPTGTPIMQNTYHSGGENGLEDIEDTSYWHYCIQQNLYRYILEQKYGLKIGKMYLVVFSQLLQNYCKLEVPLMPKTIQIILSKLPCITSK